MRSQLRRAGEKARFPSRRDFRAERRRWMLDKVFVSLSFWSREILGSLSTSVFIRLVVFCRCSRCSRCSRLMPQRCSSAHHCCNAWLFVLLSPSCQLRPASPFSPDLSHQRCVSAHRTAARWMFFKTENPSFWDTQTTPSGTYNHSTVKVTEITFLFPVLIFGLKNGWTSWPRPHAFVHLVAAIRLAD